MSDLDKFDRIARGYSAHDYADPSRYIARRAKVVTEIGRPLPAGATILDLACGDANMADPLRALGYRYRGVDGSAGMIEEARARLGDGVPFEIGLMESYEPPEPVDMTLCLRAYKYPVDKQAFLRHVAGYTRTKIVFDFDPRVQPRSQVERDLRESGYTHVEFRPFFLPQLHSVPAPVRVALLALEHSGPLAYAALRVRGIWFCAASPSTART